MDYARMRELRVNIALFYVRKGFEPRKALEIADRVLEKRFPDEMGEELHG